MAKKSFLLRIDEEVYDALRRWADDELRSLNGEIEFLLRRALAERGRLKAKTKVENAGEEE
ncbi:MAG: Arc family DNA-binding protein [Bryobacterales bacterium]|nr:Arc family DNA-binding protein [Bryobacterales bacterium]